MNPNEMSFNFLSYLVVNLHVQAKNLDTVSIHPIRSFANAQDDGIFLYEEIL